MKKMNNKGFSLVELIIVIAIMAILAGALAPALIKYIAKSRRSSDANNCGTIQSSIQTAFSDEDAPDALTDSDYNSWNDLPSSASGNFWTAVNNDLSGGLAAFQKVKTTKLAKAGKVSSPTTSKYVYYIDKATEGVAVGVKLDGTVYECVPSLHEEMGGKAGAVNTYGSSTTGGTTNQG